MFVHKTVLKEEAIQGLNIDPAGTYVDCTVGGGGHSLSIVSQLNENGRLIAFDQDIQALEAAKERLAEHTSKITFVHANFRQLKEKLSELEIEKIDGILFDLGVSSPQLDHGERGFSYHKDAMLDMRMNQNQSLHAKEIVNEWSYNDLVSIFFKYGEERFSKQIARKIEAAREEKLIETTEQLVEIIKQAIPAPARRKGGHPAKRIFQALRIAVNDELGAFNDALHDAAEVVGMQGRVVVITFHSLEDRICKQAFKQWSTPKSLPKNLPVLPEENIAPFHLITKKPIVPSEEELEDNLRARSAKLRIAEKVAKWDQSFAHNERWKR